MKTVKSVFAIALVVLTSAAFSTAGAMTIKGAKPQGAASNAAHKPVVKSTKGDKPAGNEGVAKTEHKTAVKKTATKKAVTKKTTTKPVHKAVKTGAKPAKTTTTTTEKK